MGYRKMGLWAVTSLVIGSQVGSGMFVLPSVLAPFGYFSIFGWLIAGIAAISLALVFGLLCSLMPKTGGPHAYVQAAFGHRTAFFIGWAYWLVSWASTVIVIITSIGYISPLINSHNSWLYLALEIILVFFITALNLKGVYFAGKTGSLLAILKYIPLTILPCIALRYFKLEHLTLSQELVSQSSPQLLSQVAMLTMWGFIGVETATTPAGSVHNPSKTVPLALVLGTTGVALIYLLNSLGIMGMIPAAILAESKAPYVDATRYLFSGDWYVLVAIMVSLVCIITVNVWTLVSGQIILGLAEDGLMPKIFRQTNRYGSPYWGILASAVGTIIILMLTANKNLTKQITMIIDYSLTVFLLVYLISSLSAAKLVIKNKLKIGIVRWCAIGIAITFCTWVLYSTHIDSLIVALLFMLSGMPLYLILTRSKTK